MNEMVYSIEEIKEKIEPIAKKVVLKEYTFLGLMREMRQSLKAILI